MSLQKTPRHEQMCCAQLALSWADAPRAHGLLQQLEWQTLKKNTTPPAACQQCRASAALQASGHETIKASKLLRQFVDLPADTLIAASA